MSTARVVDGVSDRIGRSSGRAKAQGRGGGGREKGEWTGEGGRETMVEGQKRAL